MSNTSACSEMISRSCCVLSNTKILGYCGVEIAHQTHQVNMLSLKVKVMTIDALGYFLNRIVTAPWEGMGEVVLARYELALVPPTMPNHLRVLRFRKIF